MKIEIGESLICSYLKHIEGCRIVQTNWKTSGQWSVTEYDKEQAKLLFEKIKESPSFSTIFKNNSFEQLIKQAEIDVLGLNTTENSIFGIDVAFHSAGLNYGNPTETASIVMKKIFRAIFIMQSYFKEFDKFNSYFVTPKANSPYKTLIDDLIIEAKDIINDDSISIEFISNEEFYLNMVDPLINNVFEEHDTMELFLRAVKLLHLDTRIQSPASVDKPSVQYSNSSKIEKRTVDGMKIGQFVQYNMRKVFEQKLLGEDEISNLQDKNYSKKIFNQNFEVLRNINLETKDKTGRNRYYTNEIFFNNYHLTSQWFEYHWEFFLAWLTNIGKQKTVR
jgi:hypothetical protein